MLTGRAEHGMVTVTNLPSRPAPVLARTLTSLSALSGGRVILGIGARWATEVVPAVREAITR